MLKPFALVTWIVLVAAPFALSLVLFAVAPDVVAMQYHFDGEVSRYGSKVEFLILGGAFSAFNLVMALCFAFADKLFAMGLLNAKSPRSGRIALMAVAAFLTVALVAVGAFCIVNTPR